MKEILLRTSSGLLYVFLIVISLILSEPSFILLIFLFSALATYEFQKLIQYKSPIPLLVLSLLFFNFYTTNLDNKTLNILILPVVLTNLYLIYWLFYSKKISFNHYQKIHFSILYLVGSSFFIIATIRLNKDITFWTTLYIYILIWINNIFAFVVGKLIGKTPMMKSVSPNKTWEGFFGGAIFCMFASVAFFQFTNSQFALWFFLSSAILIAILATVGDLIQSKFKRLAKVKDSGSLIPGHGGFFDRMDSIIFTAPIIYLFNIISNYVS